MSKAAPIWSPTFDDRPLSWSQLSAFDWNKEEWYDRYVLFKKPIMSKEMEFGNMVDKRLQEDPKFFPEIPRHKFLQHKLNFKFGKINIVAIIDSYKPLDPLRIMTHPSSEFAIIDDYKTGKKKWDQERADETGQLTLYTFGLWQMHKVHPDYVKLGIWWIPTQENGDFSISQLRGSKVVHVESKRSMKQVLQFGKYINKTVKEMEAYVKAHK